MARGWESKSVESQQEAAESRKAARQTPPTTAADRAIEMLQLSRIRVQKDLESATNPRYRQQLEAALEHLDQQLKEKSLKHKA